MNQRAVKDARERLAAIIAQLMSLKFETKPSVLLWQPLLNNPSCDKHCKSNIWMLIPALEQRYNILVLTLTR